MQGLAYTRCPANVSSWVTLTMGRAVPPLYLVALMKMKGKFIQGHFQSEGLPKVEVPLWSSYRCELLTWDGEPVPTLLLISSCISKSLRSKLAVSSAGQSPDLRTLHAKACGEL